MNPIYALAVRLKLNHNRPHAAKLGCDLGYVPLPENYAPPEPRKQHPDAKFWRNVDMADVLTGYKERLVLKRRDNRWWIDVVAVPLDAPDWSATRWARKGISHYDAETCFRMAVYAMMELDGAPTEAKELMRSHLRLMRGKRIDMPTPFWSHTLAGIGRDSLDPPVWVTPEARAAWRSSRDLIPYWYHSGNPHYRHRRPPTESGCSTADPAVDWYSGGWVGPHKPAGFRE